ncbi:MAG: hypothetical protein H0U59_09460 [Gemmatimonadaceae bacterium]|nr:hypothetical protein [Gemmatimonadaceae bacterium]
MDETTDDTQQEMTAEELQELVVNTTTRIFDALDGISMVAHLSIARNIVGIIVGDMVERGYPQDACQILRQIDAEIRETHDRIVAEHQQAESDGQEENAA